jgi:hypothetical protein
MIAAESTGDIKDQFALGSDELSPGLFTSRWIILSEEAAERCRDNMGHGATGVAGTYLRRCEHGKVRSSTGMGK